MYHPWQYETFLKCFGNVSNVNRKCFSNVSEMFQVNIFNVSETFQTGIFLTFVRYFNYFNYYNYLTVMYIQIYEPFKTVFTMKMIKEAKKKNSIRFKLDTSAWKVGVVATWPTKLLVIYDVLFHNNSVWCFYRCYDFI